ncbi:2Fe-2S iron-sulfur cluster-binding protein [Streptomyces sp. NBC_01314]|uniref:2Fe-2S iron-sulfur cluster-binding protein n=1 Tax=Streptomyces sp. NBC_01314 TaxID=2903821 RepID=UPI00352CFF69
MNRKNHGLAGGDEPHPVQGSLLEQDVAPCGYCRPGPIMAAVALLKRTKNSADADEIANPCRCGTIKSAAARTG